MTTHGNHRTEKNWSRVYLPTLNDINAKLTYVIELLKEERRSCGTPPHAREGEENEENGEGCRSG